MSVTYLNAPLVEIIAEVRWGPASDAVRDGGGSGSILVTLPQTKDEELLMHFGAEISKRAFGRIERLSPPGMPMPVGQSVCRFRPTDVTKQSPLFQLGRGVFTSNALPPDYKSWAEFAPIVRTGLDALFESHTRASEAAPNISMVLVRYVDAFGPSLTDGMQPAAFIRNVLGIDIKLPRSISSLSTADEVRPSLQFSVPTKLGQLQVALGSTVRNNQEAVILDTTMIIQRDIGANAEAALAALTEARGAIHDLFRELTAPIHAAMGPA